MKKDIYPSRRKGIVSVLVKESHDGKGHFFIKRDGVIRSAALIVERRPLIVKCEKNEHKTCTFQQNVPV